ncbi:hypothetical protein [Pelagicoccus sp. SDUM812003]|uniref:hypothetical protein n=1 Tax=Pelagicoccus sp. SDUM812003 TaxID=3041267 RepID=UPI0028102895|nr:hypothetical protein [Pelagicoccus sp. SDUM812003]MDQ8202843.1 hypothetical protein [Pelagicoccus sp. SDUM812003]
MAYSNPRTKGTLSRVLSCSLCLAIASSALSNDDLERRLSELATQNETLLKLAQQQQAEIAALKQRLESLESEDQAQELAIQDLQDSAFQRSAAPARKSLNERLIVSGEAGLAFFAGEKNNEFPNEEFRVDDARLFLEAELSRGIYLVGGLELFRRESDDEGIEVGSLFVDFENALGLEGELDRLVNLRLGRFDIPFGEEYLNRYVMQNPLISHSVADLWGIDQGVELYGDLDRFSYAVAVQNGNTSLLRDFDSDKSIAGRIGYQVTNELDLSLSLMRTGDLDAARDQQSELWIGNVVFVPIGSDQTTQFSAELAQLDFSYLWEGGSLLGAYGEAWYHDDDPLGDNGRDFSFYHLEARQSLSDQLYLAARFSSMEVDGGYPIAGNGARSIYLFGGTLTEQLERASLGLGYWINDDTVMKVEYTIENGEQTDGNKRQDTDQFAAELGVRF